MDKLVVFLIVAIFSGCDKDAQKTIEPIDEKLIGIEEPIESYFPIDCSLDYNNYTLRVSKNKDILRNGCYDDDLTFVFELNGEVVLGLNGNRKYDASHPSLEQGSMMVWLTGDNNERVSNIVEYIVGGEKDAYEIKLGENYLVTRSGNVGDNVILVFSHEDEGQTRVNLSSVLSYTLSDRFPSKNYRVWLESNNTDSSNQVISNILKYTVPDADDSSAVFPFNLNIDQDYIITRSGTNEDYPTWVVIKNGTRVPGGPLDNELSYIYSSSNTSDFIQVWLEGWVVELKIERASNIIEYTNN